MGSNFCRSSCVSTAVSSHTHWVVFAHGLKFLNHRLIFYLNPHSVTIKFTLGQLNVWLCSHRHIWTVANLARWGQIFSKKFCLKIRLVGLFIDQKEVFLDTKANFGPKCTLTIVDIHYRGISILVIRHVNSVSFGICWPIWRGQQK